MTVAQSNARLLARGRSAAAGVTHVRHRHRERYTVVGNHLAQHPDLSACAIGIGVYIQSVPNGAVVSIRALVARFKEGERRISDALHELEAAGYLERTVVRLPDARVITRTTWYEHPVYRGDPSEKPSPHAPKAAVTRTVGAGVAAAAAEGGKGKDQEAAEEPFPEELVPAARVLAGLVNRDPRLYLSEREVRRLAPLVKAWLDRGTQPGAVLGVLAGDPPTGSIRWPGRLIEYRLREWLPPRLAAGPLPSELPGEEVHVTPPAPKGRPMPEFPLITCDRCDRAFRGPEGTYCRSCRTTA